MKFKAKFKGYELLSEDELLYKLLTDRGVEDVDAFLNVSKSNVEDGMKLNNMSKGLDLLHRHLEKGSTIAIRQDCDFDGVASTTVMAKYLEQIKKDINITFLLPEAKEHSINLKQIQTKTNFEIDLLIVPDAGTNDIRELEYLNSRGIDVLILDHHKADIKERNPYGYNCPYAIVINCQDGSYPNPDICGVGVVYKFIKEYDKRYGYNYADNYLDLVALGNIADSMDLRSLETRYLVLEGLKQCNSDNTNLFIKELMLKQAYRINGDLTIMGAGLNISPIINGTIRSGEETEKIDMLKAFLEIQEDREYQPRRVKKTDDKPPVEIQTLQQTMARVCANAKARQDKKVSKVVDTLCGVINEKGLAFDNKVIIVDGSNLEDMDKTFTGLVANKLANRYHRPCILLRTKDKDTFGGSMRNYNLFEDDNFQKTLNSTGIATSIGHPNAGGVNVLKKDVEALTRALNEIYKDVKIEDVYNVDFEIPIGRLRPRDISQVGKWKDIWGNGIDQPLFAITNIILTEEDFKLLGEKKNFLKIVKKIGSTEFTFVKGCSEKEYNTMLGISTKGFQKTKKNNKFEMEIVGKFEVNTFNEQEHPQINIVDYNIKPVKEFRF